MSTTMLEASGASEHQHGAARAPRMMRVAEAAKRLDLPEKRVYILARQGLLPHVRLGRSIRFDEADLEAHIAAGGAGYQEGQ